jgi:hypothetical protein
VNFDEFMKHAAPFVQEWLDKGSIQQIETLI